MEKKYMLNLMAFLCAAFIMSSCGGSVPPIEQGTAESAAAEVAAAGEAAANAVSAVKTAAADIAAAAKPLAVNAGAKIELDKDVYLASMDKIFENVEAGKLNAKIAIPSMGVLFQIGKSEVLNYYGEMLNDFTDLYKYTDGKAKILIEGYSSNGGNETEKNPKLSQQRAQAVADHLVNNGIPKENLEIKAYSNTKVSSGIFAGDKGCKAGQCFRRVNVSIK